MRGKNSACTFSELTPTGVGCPQCRKGELNPARGRFGTLYFCTATGGVRSDWILVPLAGNAPSEEMPNVVAHYWWKAQKQSPRVAVIGRVPIAIRTNSNTRNPHKALSRYDWSKRRSLDQIQIRRGTGL